VILFKIFTRILAFVGKELVEVARRPGAIFSLVLGPFLILALFGAGYSGFRRPLDVVLVIPPESGLPADESAYGGLDTPGLQLADLTEDRDDAEAALRAREVDIVVVAPTDAEAAIREGRRSKVEVLYNLIDPVQEAYVEFLASRLEAEVNRRIIEVAAGEGQAYALTQGQADAAQIPPDVIASPTEAETRNIAPMTPTLVAFYAPGVLALILQHMAVSLIAISLVRERSTGVMELFRVAPISATEILLGKLAAFGILNAAIASISVVLLHNVLGVPILGDPLLLAGVIALLVLASLCLGIVVALIADSERQAVQLTLILLLATVFFSGLFLAIEEFVAEVRPVAYALPATHGVRLIQDLMLRGSTTETWQVVALAGIGTALLVGSWMLLRFRMRGA
jgi:ABC-2 type transport system permease protein